MTGLQAATPNAATAAVAMKLRRVMVGFSKGVSWAGLCLADPEPVEPVRRNAARRRKTAPAPTSCVRRQVQDFAVSRATAARASGAISSTTGNANNHAVSQALVQAPTKP